MIFYKKSMKDANGNVIVRTNKYML